MDECLSNGEQYCSSRNAERLCIPTLHIEQYLNQGNQFAECHENAYRQRPPLPGVNEVWVSHQSDHSPIP
jgi:hypothetical protein